VLNKEEITSPIIGAIKVEQLEVSIHAFEINLRQEDIAYLEEPYLSHHLIGFE